MQEFWIRWILNVVSGAYWSWIAWSVLTAIELVFPRCETRLRTMLRGALFWVPTTFLIYATSVSFSMLRDQMGWQPLIALAPQSWFSGAIKPVGMIVGPFLGMLTFDFCFYWMHRTQHRFFWRFHAVHHAIRDLTAINSYPHWSEAIFQIVFMTAPATFLFAVDPGPTLGVVTAYMFLHGHYIHSSTRLNFGPLVRRVLCDNRFHRIHHSVDPVHFDRNFGSATTLWDQLFGTAYFPARDEWPAVGLDHAEEVEGMIDLVSRPFRHARGRLQEFDQFLGSPLPQDDGDRA